MKRTFNDSHSATLSSNVKVVTTISVLLDPVLLFCLLYNGIDLKETIHFSFYKILPDESSLRFMPRFIVPSKTNKYQIHHLESSLHLKLWAVIWKKLLDSKPKTKLAEYFQ